MSGSGNGAGLAIPLLKEILETELAVAARPGPDAVTRFTESGCEVVPNALLRSRSRGCAN
jgi:hypothetical protein